MQRTIKVFNQKLIWSVVVFLAALGLATFLFKQQGNWEELNSKVDALYQEGRYAEAVPFAQEALR